MAWISQNWLWILFAVGIFLLMRHRRTGIRERSHNHFHDNADQLVAPNIQLKDPVSGEPVNVDSTVNSTYQGRLYYFTSKENREKFELSPAQYASAEISRDNGHHHHRHGC